MAIQITPLPLFLENQKPQNQNDPEFTIVGMGNIREEKKSRKPVFPNKLQYVKMKQIPAKKCFKSYLPELNKKPLPKDFTKSLKKGFCLKGKNKETSCTGDSGAPAFWHNNNGEAYLAGILYMGNCFYLSKMDYTHIKAQIMALLTCP